ncbi:hypothetical protein ACVWY3_000601 [Bradyrhizobium sp. USDA 4486]
MTESLACGAAAAPLSMRAAASLTSAAVRAARQLLVDIEHGCRIDAAVLRGAMEAAFGASDAAGGWNWKTAYDVCEAATVLFLRKFGPAKRAKASSTAAMLPLLARIGSCLPTHTRRSEDIQAFQQFSTPISLGLAACTAADTTTADGILEPSVGTGLLAILAELAGGSLMLNELAESRAALLDDLFVNVEVTRFDAAQINDHLEASDVRSVVLMNPPFSAVANGQRDWSALGMERLLVTPLSRFRKGTPIRLSEGILFTTYATLRTDERGETLSRVRQIVEWLGSDFGGVIVFDESHAMQNAVGGGGERGDQAASQQGRAGLRLQHGLPNAGVVYVSATGLNTVYNLAYTQRLGLWGGADFPFATRVEFAEAIEQGGVAAMEVLARDLTMRDRLRPYGLFGEITAHVRGHGCRRRRDLFEGARHLSVARISEREAA